MRRACLLLVAALLAPVVSGCILSGDTDRLRLGTTTSTRDSGLLDVLLPAFTASTGVRVSATVAGTGEVLEKARRGDLDVVLTHSPEREAAFVAAGDGAARRVVMENRFLLVGPASDPAGLRDAPNASAALGRIESAAASFVSRGDRSGTHDRELALWRAAGFDVSVLEAAPWYRETGSGQAETLFVADERGAYTLTDEATWLQLRAAGRLAALDVAFADDAALVNAYAVIVVASARHPEHAERFANWLVSSEAQAVIASFRIGDSAPFRPPTEAST